jgi:hypothetical protein
VPVLARLRAVQEDLPEGRAGKLAAAAPEGLAAAVEVAEVARIHPLKAPKS